jgi:adenylate cyclase
MMKLHTPSIAAMVCAALAAIYLFASAPTELPESGTSGGQAIPAAVALAILDAENAAIRKLYTLEIVGAGSKQGLKFREDWKQAEVTAGPLPALLLRETSNRLQLQVPELNLVLGSDFPIVKENLFKGVQADQFQAIKQDLKPRFFYDEAQGRSTAMFPDFASAPACVSCHNEHPNSPKKDWNLNDPMGATTWSYRGTSVQAKTLIRMVEQLRLSAVASYSVYLAKVSQFDPATRPEIGDHWPRDGRYLPSAKVFQQELERINSASTLSALFAANNASEAPHAK